MTWSYVDGAVNEAKEIYFLSNTTHVYSRRQVDFKQANRSRGLEHDGFYT